MCDKYNLNLLTFILTCGKENIIYITENNNNNNIKLIDIFDSLKKILKEFLTLLIYLMILQFLICQQKAKVVFLDDNPIRIFLDCEHYIYENFQN